MVTLLRWWLIFSLMVVGTSISVYFGIHIQLYNSDVTHLSFFILAITLVTSLWIGVKTYQFNIKRDFSYSIEVGWFIAEACLVLGMIGTVTGFLLMLGTAFANIDVTNSLTLQQALSDMAIGMSTALWTTLVGLICSLILKVQLINFESGN
jgi:hypothetical protein